jgi:O-antigen/teichoic acid export membrane protein
MRFWPGGTFSDEAFVSTLGVLYLRLFVPIALIGVALFFYFGEAYYAQISSGFLLLAGFTVLMIGQQLQSAQMLPGRYALMTICYALLALTLGSSMAYMGYGPVGVVLGTAIGMLVPAVIISAKSWALFDRTLYTPELTQKLLIYGTPLAASFFLDEIANLSDRYMLAWLVAEAEAGKYSVGYDLAGNTIMMIMNAINLAAYPMIVKLLDTKGKEAALEYFNTYVILLLSISIPAVVGLSLVGPGLASLVIGEEYQEAVILILPWVASAIFFMGLGAFYLHLPFQLGNKNGGIFKIGIYTAIINLALNFWLIPSMGMLGAAIATLVSFAMSSALGVYFSRKVFPLPFPAKEILKIIIAAAFMGICLWLVKDQRGWLWLCAQMFIGLSSYGLATYLLNTGGIKQLVAAHYAK